MQMQMQTQMQMQQLMLARRPAQALMQVVQPQHPTPKPLLPQL
jgi:hypothetical protein